MYPSRKDTLKLRIYDLNALLETVNRWSVDEAEHWAMMKIDRSYSDEELNTVDINELYRESDITRAIDLATEELKRLISAPDGVNE